MAEVKKFWIVSDPPKVDGSWDWIWEDPAIVNSSDVDGMRMAQFCGALSEGGYSIHGLVRVYDGTETVRGRWDKEHTKVYDDEGSAKTDATKRMNALKKIYDRRHSGTKEANEAIRWKA